MCKRAVFVAKFEANADAILVPSAEFNPDTFGVLLPILYVAVVSYLCL
jgi:hypothetical protein